MLIVVKVSECFEIDTTVFVIFSDYSETSTTIGVVSSE